MNIKLPKWLIVWTIILGYAACGFLTFGYVLNRIQPDIRCVPDTTKCFDYSNPSKLLAAPAALFWPAYWAAVKAIEVTKP